MMREPRCCCIKWRSSIIFMTQSQLILFFVQVAVVWWHDSDLNGDPDTRRYNLVNTIDNHHLLLSSRVCVCVRQYWRNGHWYSCARARKKRSDSAARDGKKWTQIKRTELPSYAKLYHKIIIFTRDEVARSLVFSPLFTFFLNLPCYALLSPSLLSCCLLFDRAVFPFAVLHLRCDAVWACVCYSIFGPRSIAFLWSRTESADSSSRSYKLQTIQTDRCDMAILAKWSSSRPVIIRNHGSFEGSKIT